MKILILIWYFLRSLILRGPIGHFRLLRNELHFENKFKIKTSAFKKSDSSEFFHYQGASYWVVFRVLQFLPANTINFDFIDIGCGKGRVLFIAEYLGYSQLTGIELDQDLISVAQTNLNLYPFKRKESKFLFFCENALSYPYESKPSVYFLFNPFNEKIMEQVLDRIIRATHEETYFVYLNPKYNKAFEQKNIQLFKVCKTGFYTEAKIYKLKAKL